MLFAHTQYPFRPLVAALAFVLVAHADLAAAAKTGGFSINIPKTRETARNFYNAVYTASNNIAMGWTGRLAGCVPGTVSTAYLNAGLTRVNYFRAMAGVPAKITFLADYNQKAQQAALMMLANQNLSHNPPTNWTCYTANGATAAGSSNLAAGSAGAASIDGYIDDEGVSSLGHRRWIVYPQTQIMGQGSVADSSKSPYREASALWVFDSHMNDARPTTRDGFVAWPPKGYVPYALLYKTWSFSYPNADFSQALVTLTQGTTNISVTVSRPGNGFGENTLAFTPTTALTPSTADKTYRVVVSNVKINGVATNFTYEVKAFDPAVKTSASVTPVISGNAQLMLNQPETYTYTPVPGAEAYQRQVATLSAFATVFGAESNTTTGFKVDADTTAYSVIASDMFATGGKYAFHLAHPAARTQTLTWNYTFFVRNAQATVKFDSLLGWATSAQSAQVQVSVDSGKNWKAVYQQAGSGGSGESSFVARSVSLAAYAGKIVQIRFAYVFNGGSYYPQANKGVGWYLDNLSLANVSRVTGQSLTSLGKVTSFGFTPTAANAQYLFQVRAMAFGGYPLEWGPGFTAKVAP